MEFIKKAIKLSNKRLGSVDAQLFMSDMYDIEYGIYNHLVNKDNPISTVSFFESENTIDDSPLEESLRRYADSNIRNVFKISVLEYLMLPRHYIELMIKISLEESNKRSKSLDELENELENS